MRPPGSSRSRADDFLPALADDVGVAADDLRQAGRDEEEAVGGIGLPEEAHGLARQFLRHAPGHDGAGRRLLRLRCFCDASSLAARFGGERGRAAQRTHGVACFAGAGGAAVLGGRLVRRSCASTIRRLLLDRRRVGCGIRRGRFAARRCLPDRQPGIVERRRRRDARRRSLAPAHARRDRGAASARRRSNSRYGVAGPIAAAAPRFVSASTAPAGIEDCGIRPRSAEERRERPERRRVPASLRDRRSARRARRRQRSSATAAGDRQRMQILGQPQPRQHPLLGKRAGKACDGAAERMRLPASAAPRALRRTPPRAPFRPPDWPRARGFRRATRSTPGRRTEAAPRPRGARRTRKAVSRQDFIKRPSPPAAAWLMIRYGRDEEIAAALAGRLHRYSGGLG